MYGYYSINELIDVKHAADMEAFFGRLELWAIT